MKTPEISVAKIRPARARDAAAELAPDGAPGSMRLERFCPAAFSSFALKAAGADPRRENPEKLDWISNFWGAPKTNRAVPGGRQ